MTYICVLFSMLLNYFRSQICQATRGFFSFLYLQLIFNFQLFENVSVATNHCAAVRIYVVGFRVKGQPPEYTSVGKPRSVHV